ncbi:methyl-accepting chemotaxis protein [Pseudobacteriovorax antillogorgiicola]|uniref:Methyl-accepting chemotaxis protein n=1 Tax=Pseudobacteriovorax antillogorgiicola TaxID=1513793 RepID=A0A1Y6BNE3_9BACT|nr:PAS domain-containing methyl-accepting chemotaxis protein [Pseudobacteriovorax antillogorgiicola]TCS55422.1 methyl-accepting chemotaxis protein [Pseudobacteriovorax antillogorgiicola]SMF12585.1 methyl-accepting chemotaxis protein [Pseudobacteriovorax antillogorgiicola]
MTSNLATNLSIIEDGLSSSVYSGMSNNSPINIIYCDKDLKIMYLNPRSIETLGKISQYLPVPVNQVLGSNIDIFHKNPAHQRRLLADPRNLPHRTTIELGPERLDLHVSAIYDEQGEHIGSMATWDIVTEKLALEEKQEKMEALVSNANINIMYANLDGTIEYVNPKSLKTLKTIEQYLPVRVEEIQGGSYDIFHKNPSFQRGLLANDSNLPHEAQIQVGPEILNLSVSAMYDSNKNYIGPMLNWEVVTEKIALESRVSRINCMVESSPTNVMFASRDGIIEYLNPKSLETLRSIQNDLPVSADKVQGGSYDVFHKNPSHQRQLLSDPRNLPHNTRIEVGSNILDLLVTAIYDNKGEYVGPMVTWDVVTEKVELEKKSARMNSMIENAPINILMADLDFNMVYMNPASRSTLTRLQHLLPRPVNQLLGQSIDIFHKNPSHQRSLLSNPANLPHSANIKLGDETLNLVVSAIYDHENTYIGPMVSWSIVTEKLRLVESLKEAATQVSTASEEVTATSREMETNAQCANAESTQAASASEEISAGVQQVAHSSEELRGSISEISQNMNETSRLVTDTLREAEEADKKMSQLSSSSKEIGDVIKVINSIAQQTNLLALNATIEAARAGDAGRGFSVVANEVKELANQTAAATDEITKKIVAIQEDTKSSVDAIKIISSSISKINDFASQISAAVQEQNATTDELTRISNEASEGVNGISSNIKAVSQSVNQTATNSQQLVDAAKSMMSLASTLNQLVQEVDDT